MTRPCRALRRDLRCLTLLAALAVGALWRCNFMGRVLAPVDLLLIMEPWRHHSHDFPEFKRVGNPILDAVQQFYPWRQFAGESLARGELPLWNPYELCGNPFVGNNQSAVFYPETWLHAVLPTSRALGWATSLYFFLSGALMFWFLRVLGLRRASSLLGAIAFMFNGFVVGWLCFPSFRSVPGWLPGMLVGVELLRRRRRAGGVALIGATTGLQFLAGNLHISLYVLLVFAAYALWRASSNGWREGVGTVALAGAGAILGGAFAASQLLPTLECATMSSRSGGHAYGFLIQHALSPKVLLTALMPDLFGNPTAYNHWGATLGKTYRAYTESAFYVGVVPLLFLPLALVGRRGRLAVFWVGVGCVGALLATGTPLNAVLYHGVPLFKSLPGIGRAVVLLSISLPILGALGAETYLSGPDPRRPLLFVTAVVLGVVGLVAGLVVWFHTGTLEAQLPGIGDYTLLQVGRFLGFLVVGTIGGGLVATRRSLGVAVLVACLTADLFLFVDHFAPACNPAYLDIQSSTIETIRSAEGPQRVLSLGRDAIHRMAPNTPMIAGLEDVQGSDSLDIGAYRQLLGAISSDAFGCAQPDPWSPVLDLLAVTFVHSSFSLPDDPKLELLDDSEGYLYRNRQALPRARCHQTWKRVRDPVPLMTSSGFTPADSLLLSGAVMPATKRAAHSTGEIVYKRVSPNEVVLSGALKPHQLVSVADTYYPGWRAFQGVAELPIMRAYHALRALETVSSDPVHMVYLPQSLRVGLFVSLTVLSVLSGLAVGAGAVRRRRTR